MPRILIAEDDQFIGQTLHTMLVSEGYDVDWKSHGELVKQAIEANHYHIVILDSNLPKISGLELLIFIRKHDKEIPIIILTAQNVYKHRQDCIEAGASIYMTKPFDFDDLLEKIESFIPHDKPVD